MILSYGITRYFSGGGSVQGEHIVLEGFPGHSSGMVSIVHFSSYNVTVIFTRGGSRVLYRRSLRATSVWLAYGAMEAT